MLKMLSSAGAARSGRGGVRSPAQFQGLVAWIPVLKGDAHDPPKIRGELRARASWEAAYGVHCMGPPLDAPLIALPGRKCGKVGSGAVLFQR